jgi:hypothetical protein
MSRGAATPTGVPRCSACTRLPPAPVPARSNLRNTGGSGLVAAYNRLSAAFDWAETADPG